jgi:hypothetical protein
MGANERGDEKLQMLKLELVAQTHSDEILRDGSPYRPLRQSSKNLDFYEPTANLPVSSGVHCTAGYCAWKSAI